LLAVREHGHYTGTHLLEEGTLTQNQGSCYVTYAKLFWLRNMSMYITQVKIVHIIQILRNSISQITLYLATLGPKDCQTSYISRFTDIRIYA
jgi:hypothetical protein